MFKRIAIFVTIVFALSFVAFSAPSENVSNASDALVSPDVSLATTVDVAVLASLPVHFPHTLNHPVPVNYLNDCTDDPSSCDGHAGSVPPCDSCAPGDPMYCWFMWTPFGDILICA
jgi:hypothetical protein